MSALVFNIFFFFFLFYSLKASSHLPLLFPELFCPTDFTILGNFFSYVYRRITLTKKPRDPSDTLPCAPSSSVILPHKRCYLGLSGIEFLSLQFSVSAVPCLGSLLWTVAWKLPPGGKLRPHWAHLICFPSLRDQNTMLPLVQRLKKYCFIYFVQFSSCLKDRRINTISLALSWSEAEIQKCTFKKIKISWVYVDITNSYLRVQSIC